MKKYLLPKEGNWYKANLHCHSTFSDGKKTPQEIKDIYTSKGYSIVAYTDHDVLIPHDELTDENFLALHGVELEVTENIPGVCFEEVKTCHVCYISIKPENIIQPCWHREAERYLGGNAFKNKHLVKFDENEPDFVREYTPECISKMMQIGREKGFFVTYNHPTWSKEFYPDYIGYKGMHAMEMFNGGCLAYAYEEYNPRVYDDFLQSGNMIYCIGADDNHNKEPDEARRSDSGWAYTVIKADKLEYNTITDALVKGNFYASEGPEIYDLYVEDNIVYVTTSPADCILATYGTRRAMFALATRQDADSTVTKLSFKINPTDKYFRVTVTDKKGRRACTNAYPVAQFFEK